MDLTERRLELYKNVLCTILKMVHHSESYVFYLPMSAQMRKEPMILIVCYCFVNAQYLEWENHHDSVFPMYCFSRRSVKFYPSGWALQGSSTHKNARVLNLMIGIGHNNGIASTTFWVFVADIKEKYGSSSYLDLRFFYIECNSRKEAFR